MKVLHCCLAAFYIDNYGYQENVLPRMHKLQGHEVAILASTETYVENKALGYVEPSSYFTEDSIPITRLPYAQWLPHRIVKKIRIYQGLRKALDSFAPDILFLHDCQFLDVRTIVQYKKKNPQVRIYVDGHTDFGNSARGWVSKNLLHGILYRYCAQIIEPYTTMFYGVLPVRVDFFQTMYGIPAEKTDLLVLGADPTKVDFSQRAQTRASLRKSLGIREDAFVLVTGGKIDERKKIHTLMRAMKNLSPEAIQLIVFGTPNDQMKDEIESLAQHPNIRHVGWIPSEETYDYFLASDLGVFPGTHSVLWEQAVGVGLPCIFRKWEGMHHVDVGGNCKFLDSANIEEIEETILRIWQDKGLYSEMQKIAKEVGVQKFSYYDIAKRAIEG